MSYHIHAICEDKSVWLSVFSPAYNVSVFLYLLMFSQFHQISAWFLFVKPSVSVENMLKFDVYIFFLVSTAVPIVSIQLCIHQTAFYQWPRFHTSFIYCTFTTTQSKSPALNPICTWAHWVHICGKYSEKRVREGWRQRLLHLSAEMHWSWLEGGGIQWALTAGLLHTHTCCVNRLHPSNPPHTLYSGTQKCHRVRAALYGGGQHFGWTWNQAQVLFCVCVCVCFLPTLLLSSTVSLSE